MAKTIPADEKVFMVSNSTNTTYSGSAALKAMSEWYTMEDVSNTVKPYKVFTALLTQSGGSNEQSLGVDFTIIKGVTYLIGANNLNFDLKPYGAPNNEAGTSFIATTTAYVTGTDEENFVLIYNTGAPVATVLENTIGNLWFTYVGVGTYQVNSDGLFTDNNTASFITPTASSSDVTVGIYTNILNESYMYIFTNNYDTPTDSVLYNTTIEIRIYN